LPENQAFRLRNFEEIFKFSDLSGPANPASVNLFAAKKRRPAVCCERSTQALVAFA
jgi:hypothetical protein